MKNILSVISGLIITIQAMFGATTGFFYSAGPNGSYVSQGSGNIVAGAWEFYGSKIYCPGYNIMEFEFSNPASNHSWTIDIQAPNDGLLETGSYMATRFPFQATNMTGFNWSGDSRGCNTSLSMVNILEVMYSPDKKTITSFAVDFVQAEETWSRTVIDPVNDRWAFGSYRLNSSVPINTTALIPEPSSFALISLSLLSLGIRRRK